MIKKNIDLTANEMFSRERRPITSVLTRHVYANEFPWSVESIAHLIGTSLSQQPVLTGNREERKYKQMCLDEENMTHCDCCGAFLVKIPWDRTYGLCKECAKRIDLSKYKYFPWEQVENEVERKPNPLYF